MRTGGGVKHSASYEWNGWVGEMVQVNQMLPQKMPHQTNNPHIAAGGNGAEMHRVEHASMWVVPHADGRAYCATSQHRTQQIYISANNAHDEEHQKKPW